MPIKQSRTVSWSRTHNNNTNKRWSLPELIPRQCSANRPVLLATTNRALPMYFAVAPRLSGSRSRRFVLTPIAGIADKAQFAPRVSIANIFLMYVNDVLARQSRWCDRVVRGRSVKIYRHTHTYHIRSKFLVFILSVYCEFLSPKPFLFAVYQIHTHRDNSMRLTTVEGGVFRRRFSCVF